jgi:hypothetical protein
MALVALSVYLLVVVPVGYYSYGLHDAAFVLPNVGALLVWWLTFTRTWVAWDRHVAARRRAERMVVHP